MICSKCRKLCDDFSERCVLQIYSAIVNRSQNCVVGDVDTKHLMNSHCCCCKMTVELPADAVHEVSILCETRIHCFQSLDTRTRVNPSGSNYDQQTSTLLRTTP